MKKILWILHEGNISGANLAALDYAMVISKAGHEIGWVLPSNGSMTTLIKKDFNNVHLRGLYSWMIKVNSKLNYFRTLKQRVRNVLSLVELVKLILKEKPDYVFSNTITFSLGAIASVLTFRKHYWFIHEFGEEDHGIKVYPFSTYGYKVLGLLSQKVIVNSQAIYEKFNKHIKSEKLNLCYYPIIIEQTNKILTNEYKDKIFRFILIGQIAEGKGHLEVFQVFSGIKKIHENFELNVYGSIVDNEYYERLIQFIKSNGLKERILFHKNTNEPLKTIAKHDFLIMASRMEAFGKVTFEALSVGTPVIGRNTGGTKEMVIDEVNGFVYNNENELKTILLRILENKIDINLLSKESENFIKKKFDYIKLSKNLLNKLNLT